MIGAVLLGGALHGGSAGGFLAALASAVTYSFFVVFFEHSSAKQLPAEVTTFWLSVFSAVQIGAVAAVIGQWTLQFDFIGHLAHIGLGFVASAIAATFYQLGVQRCGGVRTSMLGTFEPVTSIVVGALFFHEHLTVLLVIGMVCVLAASVILVKE